MADQKKARVGWSVEDWCEATSLGRTKVFALIRDRKIATVAVGRRRVIVTAPDDFLLGLLAAA